MKRLETKKVSDYEHYKQGSISRSDFLDAKGLADMRISEINKEISDLERELLDKRVAIAENTVQVIWKNQDMYDKVLFNL